MAGRVRREEMQLWPQDNGRLSNLCGQFDEHLRNLEERLGVHIRNRGHRFWIAGGQDEIAAARQALEGLYRLTEHETLDAARVNRWLGATAVDVMSAGGVRDERLDVLQGQSAGAQPVQPLTSTQAEYLEAIQRHDVVFGEGPAGTGKTYLAVAAAVAALQLDRVERIVLVRPAVEAGEHLGFLPGDLAQKVDPYLRPIYDALYEMLSFEKVGKLIERHVIEIAPLAYMRGRTLNEAFIILDEAQNTTPEQMKMFLTRIGFGSTAVVTGDVTQIDLPPGKPSGLKHVLGVLKGVEGISFSQFTARDVVRHPLVERIVNAYERDADSSSHRS